MENKIPLPELKKLRKIRGWSQAECGEFFGVDISTVWRWENWGIPENGLTRKTIEREWQVAISDDAKSDDQQAAS